VTVVIETHRVAAFASAEGIAWAQIQNSAGDMVSIGGWAEQPSGSDSAVLPASPDPDVDQAQSNAMCAMPMIASAPFVDGENPSDNYLMAGFQATPNTWIVAHVWVARVS
jgi:hypothetical protein